ncbi:DUF1801 domain-containing protein [Echinicola sp. CAU 1574]|uniref:DUF1801 domain-containing protein n=1 Tax=Echinicola arenosa TaxID=2774144 RepID=A0ABR9AEG5_9BACT|nr:DUF1801 domain-containing protein [Echinicola arenosa]MBD8487125.1 DUF1801 domain-containing protein [Echinicola arenosa]
MLKETDQFYAHQEEPNRSCLLALRKVILSHDTEVSETKKYGMPCFCYRKKMFCYLWTDKKTNEPYLLMVEGKHLEHPKLETGNRSRMKIFRVKPTEDLPLGDIVEILGQALDLYKNGVIKIKS